MVDPIEEKQPEDLAEGLLKDHDSVRDHLSLTKPIRLIERDEFPLEGFRALVKLS